MRDRSFTLLAALVFLAAAPLWPQASNSTVRGVVRDRSGAVIPKATVALTNKNTNLARTAVSNEVGIYVIPAVNPGPYRLTVESPGMQKFEGDLTVQVQQDLTVDAQLVVGAASTQIEVADITPLLRSDSPSIGTVLERKRIEQLPINGRAITNLLQTVPGVETGYNRAYGLRFGTLLFTFDGTQHNENWEGYSQMRPPGLDAVGEFKVEINSASAKFTRPVTLIASSKSGTNQFHGALFETNRNNAIGKSRQRQDTYSKAPYLNRNEFGASAGGPVIIPGLYDGRNRTFFFSAWEARRNISPSTMQWRVPTEAMRNGDFRGLKDAQGRLYTLYDPLTTNSTTWQRQPFAYNGVANTIDPGRISPTAKKLFAVTPLPTMPDVNPLVDVNWSGLSPSTTREWTTSTRIDHRFSDKDSFFARYTQSARKELYQYGGQVMLDLNAGAVNRNAPNKAVAATLVHTFSPGFFSETMVGVTRDLQRRGTGDGVTQYSTGLGLPNPFNSTSYPQMTGTGISGYGFYRDAGFDSPSWYIQIQENATAIRGKHEFQFGFHFRRDVMDVDNFPAVTSYDWSTQATSLYDTRSSPTNPLTVALTGQDLANMYLGVTNYTSQFARGHMKITGGEYSPYFQDNWKVSSRLTLNLGLRYEVRPPISESHNDFFTFSMKDKAYVIGSSLDSMYSNNVLLPQVVKQLKIHGGDIITWDQAGMPRNLVNRNWNNLGPRLGFAYRGGSGASSFVLRGGYRISTYPVPYRSWAISQGNTFPSMATFYNSLTSAVQSPDGVSNYGLRSVPKHIAGVNSQNAIDVTDTRTLPRGSAAASFRGLDQPDGRVQDWNLTLEKEVMRSTAFRVSYVGNYGGNQEVWVRHNDSTPTYIYYKTKGELLPTGEYSGLATRPWNQTVYSGINEYTTMGWSRFNGLQLELERRYDKGFGYQLYYVTGNTLAAGGKEATDYVGSLNTYMPGAVPEDLNDRTRFLLYRRDTSIPKHRVRWNFVADLPFGKGKAIAGGASGIWNKLVGGWQAAGMGYLGSNYFALPTNVFPANSNTIEQYGYQYPIEDCRSGRCYPGYLWWNGYIPAHQINSYDANGKPNGVMGVPDSYKPAAEPLIPWPKNPKSSDPNYAFYGSNTTWVTLKNGSVQRTTYDENLHPWRNQVLPGVRQWGMDASLFKFVNITERVVLRFNIDVFNIFNHPNNPNSIGGDGVLSTRNSGSAARTTQLTLRLQW